MSAELPPHITQGPTETIWDWANRLGRQLLVAAARVDELESRNESLQRELDEARKGADNLYKPLSDLVDAIEDAGGFDGNGDTFDLREAVSALEVHEKQLPSPPEPAKKKESE